MSSPSNNPLKHRGFRQHVYVQSRTKKEMVGTVRNDGWGRQWIYCKNASTPLVPGNLVMQPDVDPQHAAETLGKIVAKGEQQIILDVTAGVALEADQLIGGMFATNYQTGKGYTYPIVGNTALLAGNTEVTITLADPLREALGALTLFSLYQPRGQGVLISADEENSPVGVTPINVSADWYFWAQKKGPALCLINGAVGAYSYVVPGAIAGSVKAMPATLDVDMPIVGQALEACTLDQHHLINLAL